MCVFCCARLWLFAWAFDLSKSARQVQAGSQICVDGFELVQHGDLQKGMWLAKLGGLLNRSELIDSKGVLDAAV